MSAECSENYSVGLVPLVAMRVQLPFSIFECRASDKAVGTILKFLVWPDRGSNLRPPNREVGALTTGPSRQSYHGWMDIRS